MSARCGPHGAGPGAPYPRLPQTGGLVVKGIGAAHYKSFTIDDSAWPPRFCKFELKLEDGTQASGGDRVCAHAMAPHAGAGSHAIPACFFL